MNKLNFVEGLRKKVTASPRKPRVDHFEEASLQPSIPFGNVIVDEVDNLKNILFGNTNSTNGQVLNNVGEEKANTTSEYSINNLKIVGITGSRGKSTVAYLVHEYLKKKGFKSILYSSIGIDSPFSLSPKNEAIENPLRDERILLDALEEAIDYQAEYLILEVNERAINLGITKDIPFDIRVLTNIIPKQNEVFYSDYVNIKKRFFKEAQDEVKLIASQIDADLIDLKNELRNRRIITFSSRYLSQVHHLNEEDIDYLLTNNEKPFDSIKGLNMNVITGTNSYSLSTNLIMPYNALNITCCVAILETLGVFNHRLFQELIRELNVPGRDEVIYVENRTIIISVNLVPHLEHLKRYQAQQQINKIIVVTGATGTDFVSWEKEFDENKYLEDKEKSIRFAYNYIKNNADFVYITTSDSGSANKEGLLAYQANMIKGSIPYKTDVDRRIAIKNAIEISKENDVIFISGRGNRRVLCDSKDTIKLHLDKEVVKEILEELNWR